MHQNTPPFLLATSYLFSPPFAPSSPSRSSSPRITQGLLLPKQRSRFPAAYSFDQLVGLGESSRRRRILHDLQGPCGRGGGREGGHEAEAAAAHGRRQRRDGKPGTGGLPVVAMLWVCSVSGCESEHTTSADATVCFVVKNRWCRFASALVLLSCEALVLTGLRQSAPPPPPAKYLVRVRNLLIFRGCS